MINTFIFDWGGVLGEDNNVFAARILSKKYKINKKNFLLDLHNIQNDINYVNKDIESEDFYNYFSVKYGFDKKDFKNTLNNVSHNSTYNYVKKISRLIPNLYLLSNQLYSRARAIEKQNDLSIFRGVFFSCDVGYSKPNIEIFKFFIDRAQVSPKSCLLIDNKKNNIEVAKTLGIHCYLYTNLNGLKVELSKYLS